MEKWNAQCGTKATLPAASRTAHLSEVFLEVALVITSSLCFLANESSGASAC